MHFEKTSSGMLLTVPTMAIRVVEFSRAGYIIGKIFASKSASIFYPPYYHSPHAIILSVNSIQVDLQYNPLTNKQKCRGLTEILLRNTALYVSLHYENKFTKTLRPTNILHIFTKF